MILTVNIGNTNTSVGFWKDGHIQENSIHTVSLSTSTVFVCFLEQSLQVVGGSPCDIDGSILASVVSDKTQLVSCAIEAFIGVPPEIVDIASEFGMDLSVYDGSLLGADRVVCCVSALAKYTPPLVVFDLGTATTVNVVDSTRAFVGGAILPGVQMGLEALATGTSLLSRQELDTNVSIIGQNTLQCMDAGVLYGAAFSIEGFTKRIEEELGAKVTTVVTGGNAAFVIPYCRADLHHEPTLLLEGLILLYQGHS